MLPPRPWNSVSSTPAVAADVHDRFLCAVQRPVRRQPPAVLRRIRVADHDLLPAVDAVRGIGHARAARAGAAGALPRSSTRSNSGTIAQPRRRLRLQHFDREHVGRRLGHRDDVGGERLRMDLAERLERVEYLADFVVRRRDRAGRSIADSRSARGQIRLPLVLVPVAVAAEAQMFGNRGERRGVARRVLPDIEPDEREAERRRAAQHIGEPAVRDDALAGLDERSVTELQRLDELRNRSVRRGRGRLEPRHIRLEQIGARELAAELIAGRAEPVAHLTEHGAIGLACAAGARPQLRVATVIDSSALSAPISRS